MRAVRRDMHAFTSTNVGPDVAAVAMRNVRAEGRLLQGHCSACGRDDRWLQWRRGSRWEPITATCANVENCETWRRRKTQAATWDVESVYEPQE